MFLINYLTDLTSTTLNKSVGTTKAKMTRILSSQRLAPTPLSKFRKQQLQKQVLGRSPSRMDTTMSSWSDFETIVAI